MSKKETQKRIEELETEIIISKRIIEGRIRSGKLTPEQKAKLETKLREALANEEDQQKENGKE